jgi:hypothetical protein
MLKSCGHRLALLTVLEQNVLEQQYLFEIKTQVGDDNSYEQLLTA